jgi:hypothetical protein
MKPSIPKWIQKSRCFLVADFRGRINADQFRCIARFLAILKEHKKTKVLKGLIVTDGHSGNLSKDSCFDGRVNARFRSGRRRAGRRQLNRLVYSDVGSSAAEETEKSDS